MQIRTPANDGSRPLRMFVYGAPRRWKSSFAGTFPKPIFLSPSQEGGDRTLAAYPDAQVISIDTMKDMQDAVSMIERDHRRYGWRTVVVDSITFYNDLVLAELTKGKTSGQIMNVKDWGVLELHVMKWLLPTLHRLPLHVIWIALENVVKGDDDQVLRIEPMIPGKMAQKLPASTDLIVYADQMLLKPPVVEVSGTSVVMRTQPYGKVMAGGRFWDAFPEGYVLPYFESIKAAIGPWIGEGGTVEVQPVAQEEEAQVARNGPAVKPRVVAAQTAKPVQVRK